MNVSQQKLKIAAWQVSSVSGTIAENLAALDAAAVRAAKGGAKLLITPEMFITGYNIGEKVRELAAEQPLEKVREIAQKHGIAIIVGGPELVETPQSGGTAAAATGSEACVMNAAWFISDTGEVLARHHKVQLFGELDRELFTAGTAPVTLATYRGHKIALLICFDVEFPETVRAAARAGAELVAVPTAQMEPFSFVNQHLIRTRAWENGIHIAYVNQCGQEGELRYVGQSVIASPLGEHLAAAAPAGEELLFAELDPQDALTARANNPYLTELRRDLFG